MAKNIWPNYYYIEVGKTKCIGILNSFEFFVVLMHTVSFSCVTKKCRKRMGCNLETQKSVDISIITQYFWANLKLAIIKILAKLGVFFQSLIKTEKSTYKGL